MNFAMATRTPKGVRPNPGEHCTEFQLHAHHNPNSGRNKGVCDYSEFRLMRYIEQVNDTQQKLTLEGVLKDYKQGRVAVAWKSGRPVWLKVTKEKN